MYLVKTPLLVQKLFPNFTWKVPSEKKEIYLTFDDGPIPEVTPWVLEQLQEYQTKATFFCVGENINRHPEIFRQLTEAGHTIGNHTFNHLNGWANSNTAYFLNVHRCAQLVRSNLFRPPHGRLMPKQAARLRKRYQIVMWDVLSGDFDAGITPQQCLSNVLKNTGNGSIVVFHDSLKAWDKLHYVLPRVLEYFTERGFSIKRLKETVSR